MDPQKRKPEEVLRTIEVLQLNRNSMAHKVIWAGNCAALVCVNEVVHMVEEHSDAPD